MKITIFTANQVRHNYFINLLLSVASELCVVQESRTIFPGLLPGHYSESKISKKHFDSVINVENDTFKKNYIESKNNKLKILPLSLNDLNNCKLNQLEVFLNSEIYIIFGSSFIKGDLLNFLVNKKAINIHMGISPYYRGTDCNFWAIHDENPQFVGSTIHLLSKGVDSGAILYHALPYQEEDPYKFAMLACKAAFHSIVDNIKNETLFNYQPITQDLSKIIRYSKNIDFKDDIVKNYSTKMHKIKYQVDKDLYINPYFLNK
tara:strand:- start:2217 stop:3002 length:786 start_codon:yes stop_codon:yes gene_type:complete